MYRTIADFLNDWKFESAATLRVLNALSPEALDQRAFEKGRSIRETAWHITATHNEMLGHAGLKIDGPSDDKNPPADLATIIATYEKAARSVAEQVEKEWYDAKLGKEVQMYGMTWTYGGTLSAFVHHELHHRAQIITLMRLAGLRVPGIYGPSLEEWTEMAESAEATA